MSHFIAHTISFSKDFKTFKVKGGDNNLVPRTNSWSGDIPIDRLYYNLNGGMIKLIGTSEKNAFIRFLIKTMQFGGEWNKGTDYFHVKNDENNNNYPKLKQFDKMFINALIDGLTSLSNEKKHIIHFKNGLFIVKANPTSAKVSYNENIAGKFTYYRAKEIAEMYSNKNPEIIPC